MKQKLEEMTNDWIEALTIIEENEWNEELDEELSDEFYSLIRRIVEKGNKILECETQYFINHK